MTARRIALALAVVACVAAVGGALLVEHSFAVTTGRGPGLIGLWIVLPIALGGAGLIAIGTGSLGFIWSTIGALCGFVVIAGFSLGPFFKWEALALVAAGCVHLDTIYPRRRLWLVPLWLMAGAFALCPVFLAVELVGSSSSAPIVVIGSWMFAAVLTLLVGEYSPLPSGRAARIVRVAVFVLVATGFAWQGARAASAAGKSHSMVTHGTTCTGTAGAMQCVQW
jgi:hypothetical protein